MQCARESQPGGHEAVEAVDQISKSDTQGVMAVAIPYGPAVELVGALFPASIPGSAGSHIHRLLAPESPVLAPSGSQIGTHWQAGPPDQHSGLQSVQAAGLVLVAAAVSP